MRLLAPVRRAVTRTIVLDRSLESLPIFRLSDSSDEGAITYTPEQGGRWRVLPAPGERLPGTFDQDVYVELLHRYADAGLPEDGAVSFTLHAFLRSIGRRVDGRTYEQLRFALGRLERTILESSGVYVIGPDGETLEGSFTLLSSVIIERRRSVDRDQLALFTSLAASEPGDARIIIAPAVRANILASRTSVIVSQLYQSLSNPVARRLYRLLEVARADGHMSRWQIGLDRLASLLPLNQRYPSHLQRVLQPAHEMLVAAGLLKDVTIQQANREWSVIYFLTARNPGTS